MTATAKAMSVAAGIAQPSGSPGVEVDDHVDERRHDDTADGSGDRHDGGAHVAELAGDELLFQLETDDEEEDREQPVGRPGPDAEVQVQTLGPEGEIAK
jgi:hypothetical protein